MSYAQLRYHIVTATKEHKPHLVGEVEHVARAMLVQSAREQGAKVFQLGGISDHMHLVAHVPRQIALSDFVQNIKRASAWAVNQENLVKGGFEWAEGYAAISLSSDKLSEVIEYVAKQKDHHKNNDLWDDLEKLPRPGEPSYTRLRYHLVTATKSREPVIIGEIEETIYSSFYKTARNKACVILKIGGIADHLHTVAAILPRIRVSYFMRDVKKYASRAVNDKGLLEGDFAWQDGYSAFTVWPFDLSGVLEYVQNQKQRHKMKDLWDEYEKIPEWRIRGWRFSSSRSEGYSYGDIR